MQERVSWSTPSEVASGESWSPELPLVVQRWMQARGLASQEAFDAFANFRLKDLADPFSLKDMDLAVDRLISAREAGERICLYADFDMDGTPGLALLIRGLQYLGFENLLSFQPNRFDDGYGVHPEIIEDFISHHDVSLFVTIDVGITDVAAVAKARELGTDFIITDHHQQKEILPEAVAIVNPNQKSCDSNLQHLCGTGVAFYLVLALRKRLQERELLEKNFDPKKLLDCFAIGTLTDMVPLVRENRTLVQHGMLQLARTERLGIRNLMEELNLRGRRLSSSDVAIQLAPKLNALGRMNSDVQALDLFLVSDERTAQQKVTATMAAQKQRTEIQKKGEVILQERLVSQADLSFVFEWSEDFYKGIVGLLATQVNRDHGVPAFVGSVMGDRIVGSARAPEGLNLLEALEAGKDHLVKFGGHKQAAGFELLLGDAEAFKGALSSFYEAQGEAPQPTLQYDFTASLDELNDHFKSWLIRLEPYGVGFALPTIRMDHLFVASTRVLKEKHLKLVLKDMAGNKIDALWFFADNIEEKKQLSQKRVSVIAEPSINHYMGQETLQVFIKDLKVEF